MIPFNQPPVTGKEAHYIQQAIDMKKLSGDGSFSMACHEWMEDTFDCYASYLTTSCTHALEMSALLADIRPGDEVIMPSYTFVSTANAFVLRGAEIVFVDIRPDTLNIDEKLVEAAITSKTKAIVPVHYAGVACEMDALLATARKYDIAVIEDAAQGVMSTYKGKALGTIGDAGCFSFHETKNYTSGEGGAILLNNENWKNRAEIIREKGTNRSQFFRGEVDKYSWVDVGSSYLPSELNAAFLKAQFDEAETINNDRLNSWKLYEELLQPLAENKYVELPFIPEECAHNAHMFYVKTKNLEERTALIAWLKEHEISSAFHYVPLHSAKAGRQFGRFHGEDHWTTRESERLIRLPMYYGLREQDIYYITNAIRRFYSC
ncbi:dTDP-4-amino-4,6-dideoxygalactose transaminase [Alteribacillus sp. HJP-4]|uniref:dTDP-4-amino-4,6-dideoxygalactose transaminase n=1 Tax=Alteribacillus sp. HJP-4 TaxID=2775394 RepID=UPI0035CD1104